MSRVYRYTASRQSEADEVTAWTVVSDPAAMPKWTPYRRVDLDVWGDADPNGVGAVRALRGFGPTVRERIVRFEPPHRLSYQLVSGLPFRDYSGDIVVERDGAGSRITCTIQFRTVFPGLQLLGAAAVRFATAGAAREATRRLRLAR